MRPYPAIASGIGIPGPAGQLMGVPQRPRPPGLPEEDHDASTSVRSRTAWSGSRRVIPPRMAAMLALPITVARRHRLGIFNVRVVPKPYA